VPATMSSHATPNSACSSTICPSLQRREGCDPLGTASPSAYSQRCGHTQQPRTVASAVPSPRFRTRHKPCLLRSVRPYHKHPQPMGADGWQRDVGRRDRQEGACPLRRPSPRDASAVSCLSIPARWDYTIFIHRGAQDRRHAGMRRRSLRRHHPEREGSRWRLQCSDWLRKQVSGVSHRDAAHQWCTVYEPSQGAPGLSRPADSLHLGMLRKGRASAVDSVFPQAPVVTGGLWLRTRR
jgi:hypothetical protein